MEKKKQNTKTSSLQWDAEFLCDSNMKGMKSKILWIGDEKKTQLDTEVFFERTVTGD